MIKKQPQPFPKELAARIDKVFEAHEGLDDQRKRWPWLTGSLGDPFAGNFLSPKTRAPKRSKISTTSPPTAPIQTSNGRRPGATGSSGKHWDASVSWRAIRCGRRLGTRTSPT